MADDTRRARNLGLLDDVDALRREKLDTDVWRLVRAGRDPTLGSPSRSRWCNGSFDVLYTSLERDGAIAEIYALLAAQPVFPTKDGWFLSRVKVKTSQTLRLADLATLTRLGVDTVRYADRTYSRTAEIADAAYFLGFDGLIAPSARWPCSNLVLFTDRVPADQIHVVETEKEPIGWAEWRRQSSL